MSIEIKHKKPVEIQLPVESITIKDSYGDELIIKSNYGDVDCAKREYKDFKEHSSAVFFVKISEEGEFGESIEITLSEMKQAVEAIQSMIKYIEGE